MDDLDVYLSGIVDGDEQEFAGWMAGAEPRVRGSLRGFAATVDTEAVVQETMLRIWQVARRHRPDGRPNGLLRQALRIARNLAIDEARRRGRHATLDDDAERDLADPDPRPPGDPLLRRAIQGCLDLLRGKPRDALRARLSDAGMSPDAVVAASLGMAANAFLQNIVRGRKQVAECLRRRGIDLGESPT